MPKSQLISPIYEDIYGPAASQERRASERRSRARSEKDLHSRKVDREICTTLRRIDPAEVARQCELHRLQQARWAAKNPDKVAAAQRKWKAKNPDYHRQSDRDRYAADPEPKKARSAAYYAKNREAINARRRAKKA